MLTTKGRDFVRHALQSTTTSERNVFLETVANKIPGAMKMRSTDLNIFNRAEGRRTAYIRTATEDIHLTSAVVQWLHRRGVDAFGPDQAALVSSQLQGHSALLCGAPGTGKTFGAVLAACHRFMHSSQEVRCHTVFITVNAAAAAFVARQMASVAGRSHTAFQVIADPSRTAESVARLRRTHPHVLIGTVPALTAVVDQSRDIFGMKLRKLVDTLIVDDADAVLAQPGGRDLVGRLYRRMRDEIPAQLVFLSATIDTAAQSHFNFLTKNENDVCRLSDSHFQYALPEHASFYLYCDEKAAEAQVALRLMHNLKWMKGEAFQPLLVLPTAEHSRVFEKALEVNGIEVENDSMETEAIALDAGGAAGALSLPEVSAAVQDASRSGIDLAAADVRLTDLQSLRGVSYSNVSDVVLFGGVPTSQQLVHAAGRAARFGSAGDVNVIFRPESARAVRELCCAHDLLFKLSAYE